MPATSPTATAVIRALREHADPVRARHLLRFFRTGPGEYGEGDRFLGVTVPRVRTVVRQFRGLSLKEVERLLESPWHEARLAAVILLAEAYPRADPATQVAIYRLYLRRTDRINSWDLVDVTAPRVVGGQSRAPVPESAVPPDPVAEPLGRRIALLAAGHFIRLGQLDDTLALATAVLTDQEDLIHKAAG